MKTCFSGLILVLLAASIGAQTTAFTYQGRLDRDGNPANGNYDLRFTVWNAKTGGSLASGTVGTNALAVSNGLFTVALDFGPGVFTGADRWLEINVRTNGGGAFDTLSRQRLTPTPYAIMAGNVGSNGLAGTYGNAVTFSNSANGFSGSFTGNGGGLTNVNAATLGGVGSNGFWRTAGNAGTTAGPNFLGTTDNQPFEIRVDSARALRIEPHGVSGPTLVGGYHQNDASGAASAVIAGGGTSGSRNLALGNYAFVGAGHGGQANAYSAVVGGAYNVSPGQFSFIGSGQAHTNLAGYSFIGGGSNNVILADSPASAIGGGEINAIQNNSFFATISGGRQNRIGTNAGAATITGGFINTIEAGAGSSVIAGGSDNRIGTNAIYSSVGGGLLNTASGIGAVVAGGGYDGTGYTGNTASGDGSVVGGGVVNVSSGPNATVAGGFGNEASGYQSTIGGGWNNTSSADYATVAGGYRNIASGHSSFVAGGSENAAEATRSFAAGTRAKASHDGSFVWADSQYVEFASTANDQFLIRASGGVGIGTPQPQQLLHLTVPAGSGEGMQIDSAVAGHAPAIYLRHTGFNGHNFRIASYGDNSNPGSFIIRDDTVGADRFSIGAGGTVRAEIGVGEKFSLGGNGNFEIDAPGVVGGRFVVRDDGRVHVGGTVANGLPKLISFGDGNFVMIGEQDADDRMILRAGNFHFINGAAGFGRVAAGNRLEVEGNASKTVAGDWLANSDRRIKTDIQTLTNALEKLQQVRLTSFRYTEDYRRQHPSIKDGKYLNVIAQEFQQVFPDSVRCSGDKLPNGDEILQVDTYPLTIYAAAAVQELNRKVEKREAVLREELKRRDTENAELKNRLAAVEEVVARLSASR